MISLVFLCLTSCTVYSEYITRSSSQKLLLLLSCDVIIQMTLYFPLLFVWGWRRNEGHVGDQTIFLSPCLKCQSTVFINRVKYMFVKTSKDLIRFTYRIHYHDKFRQWFNIFSRICSSWEKTEQKLAAIVNLLFF